MIGDGGSFLWALCDDWFLEGHSGLRNLGGGRGDGSPVLGLFKAARDRCPHTGEMVLNMSRCVDRLTPHSAGFSVKLQELFAETERQRIARVDAEDLVAVQRRLA